jgi:histidinol-phosphatase
MPSKPKTDLDRCLYLADIADTITLPFFRSLRLEVHTKPDKTPVTEADTAADTALRAVIAEEFGDAYLSEEGDQTHRSGRQWIIDPIDGTKNFMRRHPVWATLISVQDETGTLAAIITAPALGRRWWAARGKGAWTRDVDGVVRQIHVSQVAQLADAYITYCSLLPWKDTPAGIEGVISLMKQTWRERSPGDFLGHAWVAEGVVDACFEPNTKEWDMAAHAFIVTEAGGSVYTTTAPGMPARDERVILTSNGLLEDPIRKALHL